MKENTAHRIINNLPTGFDPGLLHALYEASRLSNSKDQRTTTNKAMMPVYREALPDKAACEQLLSMTPESITKRVKIKPTASEFRDKTVLAGHVALALGFQNVGEWQATFINPADNCHKDSSSTTGFALGLHKDAYVHMKKFLGDNWKKPLGYGPHGEVAAVLIRIVGEASKALVGSTAASEVVEEESEVSFADMDIRQLFELFAIIHDNTGGGIEGVKELVKRLPNINTKLVESAAGVLSMDGNSIDELEVPEEQEVIVADAISWIDKQEAKVEEVVKEAEGTPTVPVYSDDIPVSFKNILDTAMTAAGLPDISTLIAETNTANKAVAELTAKIAKMATSSVSHATAKVPSSGTLPEGKATWIKASKAMSKKGVKVPGKWKPLFEFEVPYFEWDSTHRDVPEFDTTYQWRWDIMAKLLWGLANNKKPWIHGHTGCGKTTLVEQVCSILNWPFVRINFDSEITRMDLIGRDTLQTDEHGNTVSRFADGVLPQHMEQPYVICNDELDFVRSDIAYVYQRALEDKGLLLTEDAGRLVAPHEYSRMVATANTQGQGDEFGLYQGARVQSQAFLDRFQCWIEVPYLAREAETELIAARVPSLSDGMVAKVINYVQEHREAFKQAAILKPISPRGVVSMGEALSFFTSLHPDEGEAVRLALETTVLGSVTHADAAKINELVDRCFN